MLITDHTTCHCCLLISDIAVELDEHTKTPALVLSTDRLEASNPNWTFESVHATLCIGRGMCAVSPYPAGWYYEVTLKSTGILQIGTIILRLASTTSVCFGSICLLCSPTCQQLSIFLLNVNCSRARGGGLELAITRSNRASTKTFRRYSIGNLNQTCLFEKVNPNRSNQKRLDV